MWEVADPLEDEPVDSWTTHLRVQGPPRTCNESKEEEEEAEPASKRLGPHMEGGGCLVFREAKMFL